MTQKLISLSIALLLGTLLIQSCSDKSSPTQPTTDPPQFVITILKYTETDDLDAAIKKEFGDQYRLADWDDIKLFVAEKGMLRFLSILNWCACAGNELMVSNGGNRFWIDSRHYLIARNDHNTPSNFLVHDHLDDHLIDLGSWYGLRMCALGVRK